jgi:tetratricopeptide (TPR) repeat protein
MACVVVLGAAVLASPAVAQNGQVKGKVVDAKNQPVEGALVVIESSDGMNRKYTVKTNRRGDYIQIGLQSGEYKLTATKDDLSQSFTRKLSGVNMTEVNFTLVPGGSGGEMTAEDRKKAEARVTAVKTAFEAGVTLSNEGKHDEAIAKFNEVLAEMPKCPECYNNIGTVYIRKKEFEKAEEAFKQSIALKPTPDAYNGLASVYNQMKKFDEAQTASAEAQKLGGAAGVAGGGPSAATVFNQGVIAWNASKVADAKKNFEQAIQLDPKLADAHYWLGMAHVNEGKLPEAAKNFEEYLNLAPNGQYAEQAKGILSQLKK